MKIINLTETMATPVSMPTPGQPGAKFGRSDEMLESDVGTSTAGGVAPVSKPMGKMQKRGQGSMFKGIATSSKFANSKKAGISEDELSEEQLQAKKRREENFKKAKDRELGNKPKSREIMAKESFNGGGEYNDEVDMVQNNLHTIVRVSTHLGKELQANENMPEWVQEKIAVAKSIMVTVMDYMISQHERGNVYTVDEGEVYDLGREYGADAPPRRPLPSGGSIPRRHDDEPDFMDPDQRRLRAEQERLKKANAEYYAKKNQGMAEGIFSSSENKILPLVNKISDLAGKLNAQNVEVGKKIIQSNTNDIVRMLRPQSKSGVDVIEQGVAQPKTDDNLRKYYADLKAKKQAQQQGVAEDTIDMPFGSISGKDVDIGLQHRSEQTAYSGLKRLGLVDTSEQFLTLQEIAKLVTDTSNIHIFAFDTNPVRSYVKLIKMIGWNKDNPTEYEYNPQGVAEGAPISGDGGAVDNFKQQMANNTELAYQKGMAEEWSQKYKKSINCSHPKGFSQKAHCAGKKKHNESINNVMEMTCPDCGMCKTHGDHSKDKLDELKCWSGYHRVAGTKAGFPGSCAKNKTNEEGVAEEKCPECGGPMFSEMIMNEKKDACYYKVKSRYKVWPSAYASGALVKCRNKGASNWGNGGQKSESMTEEELEESLHDWFNKEKWVRMDTKGKIKGPCAREPGEGKPKCLPQSKAHSLGKKGRASAAQRKRREDPNPDRSGKAINVNTKKKSNEGVL